MKKLILSAVLLCVAQIASLDLEQAITLKSMKDGATEEYSSTLGALKLLEPNILEIYENATDEDLAAPIGVPYGEPALTMLVPIYNALANDPEPNEKEIVQVLEAAKANPGIDFKADQADGKKLSKKQVETLRLFFGDMSDLPGNAGNTVANAVGRYLQKKDLRPLPTTQVLKLFKTGKNKETQENIYMPFAQQLYVSIAQFITDTNVTRITLDNKKIETLIGMPELPNLTSLSLWCNHTSSFVGMPQFNNLQKLMLQGWDFGTTPKKISSFAGMPQLNKLQELNLARNNISSFANMPEFPNLQELNLWDNKIRSLADLPQLNKLRELRLGNNNISSLAGMPELPNLQELRLGNHLQEFYPTNNKISSLAGLPQLPKLQRLMLEGNQISLLKWLPKTLSDILPNNAKIKELEDRGVEITI